MQKPKSNKQNKPNKGQGKGKPKSSGGKGKAEFSIAPAAIGVDSSCDMSWTPTKDGGIAEGREFLANVVVPDVDEVGANCASFSISPAEFGGTRLALKSQEYQKYRFDELDFEYEPAVGSETPGSLVFAYNRDIATPLPPSSEQGLRQYMALKNAVHGNVWKPHVCKCPVVGQKDTLWTQPEIGGDDRLGYQGQFNVAVMVPTELPSSTILGSIILKYKCRFEIQTLEDELEGAEVSNDGASLTAGTADQDYLAAIGGTPDVEGDPTYAPQLQGDGTWAVTLKEGLYRWLSWIPSGTWGGAGGVGFDAPSIQAIELEAQTDSVVEPVNKIDNTGAGGYGPSYEAYLTIPRGGGKVRQNIDTSSTLALTTGQALLNILRIGAGIATIAGVLTTSRERRAARDARFLIRAQKAVSRQPDLKVHFQVYPKWAHAAAHRAKFGRKQGQRLTFRATSKGWSVTCSCGKVEECEDSRLVSVLYRHGHAAYYEFEQESEILAQLKCSSISMGKDPIRGPAVRLMKSPVVGENPSVIAALNGLTDKQLFQLLELVKNPASTSTGACTRP